MRGTRIRVLRMKAQDRNQLAKYAVRQALALYGLDANEVGEFSKEIVIILIELYKNIYIKQG